MISALEVLVKLVLFEREIHSGLLHKAGTQTVLFPHFTCEPRDGDALSDMHFLHVEDVYAYKLY